MQGAHDCLILVAMNSAETYDAIPLEDTVQVMGPDERGMMTELFYAFNTIITLQAFGEEDACRAAFAEALDACRGFERRYSRTLPHSDIARLNSAGGKIVDIEPDTAALLNAAMEYCADSEGRFDITMGAVVRLWNFHNCVIPSQENIDDALAHVDWRTLRVWNEPGEDAESEQWRAQLVDPNASVDVGGVAKGWIADSLADIFTAQGIDAFIVNLGGNVVARGRKPGDQPWRIGLQDPRNKDGIVGAVEVVNASAVTSGVYERCFTKDGVFYHHILDPETGRPAETDIAGVTVLAQRSLDAEGYSTTLLSLGMERGIAFVREHPAILKAYFVDSDGRVYET